MTTGDGNDAHGATQFVIPREQVRSPGKMTFPVFIYLGPWRLHPHLVFELLAYTAGFQVYRWLRRRRGDAIPGMTRWSIVAAAAIGGAVGSRALYWIEDPSLLVSHWHDLQFLFAGKTIVGGLIGGLVAVESTKWWLGVTTRTGDLFAIPLAAGIAVGRVGCFLTGLEDRTHGTATMLWTGVDFGDGVRRHPTQLYEIAWLLLLIGILANIRKPLPPGDEFSVFMVGYMTCRLLLDTLKPDPTLALGMSSIQWAAVATLAYYAPDLRRWVGGGA